MCLSNFFSFMTSDCTIQYETPKRTQLCSYNCFPFLQITAQFSMQLNQNISQLAVERTKQSDLI